MSTQDVAADMAALFKAGEGSRVGEKYWADNVVSVEAGAPPGMDPVARGKGGLEAKTKWWTENHEVTNAITEGPFINGDQVGFRFEVDMTVKASGEKMHMREFALYTLKNDKIVEERFFYGS